MIFLETTFWLLVALVAYVYLGYPLLLALLRVLFGARPPAVSSSLPSVTLIVSAYNEAEVIGAKIENSLALDYPRELLEILIVSDASDDATDDIVRGFELQGVRLLRMADRGGKTVGLNAAVTAASGDIVVFSDANAMYERAAIRALVRNFGEASVAAVVGESTYRDSANDAERSESAYWKYEMTIKRLETQLGSTVGGDGAIYAIRKECYRPMAPDALSDFVNPLQIVAQGRRCIYEPEAVSIEEAAGSFEKEFRRKVRIVNRGWRAMMSMKHLLNPFRYGLFAWELISHKVLRWLAPFLLLALFIVNFVLSVQHVTYTVMLVLQIGFYGTAVAGALLRRSHRLALPLSIPFYFCLVNLACIRGILGAYRGETYTTWATARAENRL
ncbi:MAG TPA: glycosyltransferase family 2 protein [Woeseiaceae bacterium]|nr:glycosyltransferase family 2 protein [Woeseiaceae bacterium]